MEEGETPGLDRFVDQLVAKFCVEEERESYRSFCKKFDQRVLDEAYERVCDTPKSSIRKSQGALFVYLVKKLSELP